MAEQSERGLRPVLAAIGALAGLAVWLFSEVVQNWVGDPRAYLFLAAATFGFFTLLLAQVGPARLLPALPLAAGVAVVAAGLLWLGSFRHEEVESYLQLGYPLAAYGLILLVAAPFVAAALRSWEGWRDYATLFELSWRIAVRFASAVIFTALFWGLVMLSDALLQIVSVGLMDLIERFDPVPWVLTGAVFGLALAVVHEMRDYLSPYLVLRLLRLFVPVVLAVVAAFLLFLPLRGMSGLLGSLSAAGTLLTAALAAVVLVTVAVDRDADEEVRHVWLRGSVQVLALLIPVLGVLALYDIGARVALYGWTPQRLMAVSVGAVLTLYGLVYGGAVLARGPWAARIRSANVGLALVVLALCALWLSPALVPERIAARDQVARYLAGRIPAGDVPLEELARDWGYAGAAALDTLAADPVLAARVVALQSGVEQAALSGGALREALVQALPVQGGALSADMLNDLPEEEAADWLRACARRVQGGPGCFLVLAAFAPEAALTRGVLLLNRGGGQVATQALVLSRGALRVEGYVVDAAPGSAFGLPVQVLEALHRGEGRVAPAKLQVLEVEGHAFFPEN